MYFVSATELDRVAIISPSKSEGSRDRDNIAVPALFRHDGKERLSSVFHRSVRISAQTVQELLLFYQTKLDGKYTMHTRPCAWDSACICMYMRVLESQCEHPASVSAAAYEVPVEDGIRYLTFQVAFCSPRARLGVAETRVESSFGDGRPYCTPTLLNSIVLRSEVRSGGESAGIRHMICPEANVRANSSNIYPQSAAMITDGTYRIENDLYDKRYVCMLGDKSGDWEFVGHDVGDIIKVEVKDKVRHLATLYDTVTDLYIGIDGKANKVKGYTQPQVLQLSSDDGDKFEIHRQNINKVWTLKDDSDLCQIIAEAPPDSDRKYWKFEKASTITAAGRTRSSTQAGREFNDSFALACFEN
ncbi:hypothetical protein DEU56DRAFT_898329 [Suillus clintonianus]|uniref:uncharacterized protein n=1 Tax=Suillus clintonianus TaxID=1904413 RepID=UPI001B861DD9|nr:uncharacterized protein DEU56DRAFT_898329 [Suillus clintonianus]KAG2152715.1 hypothetical protein DEU56DRAFT_898329 [Suillus clintonianus]